MNVLIFVLFAIICIGFIYIVHKYFGKHEFYLLGVVYSIISFILSFKIITIFGLNANMSIIFNSGIIGILYYFVSRFGNKEGKKYIMTIMISTISCIILSLLGSVMLPSIYDDNIILFKELIIDNLAILLIYPASLLITLLLSNYSFRELKEVQKNKTFKTILALIGIVFVDVFVFIYFSYAIIIRFDDSLLIAIDNYFIKTIYMVTMYFLVNKIIKIKKVKA